MCKTEENIVAIHTDIQSDMQTAMHTYMQAMQTEHTQTEQNTKFGVIERIKKKRKKRSLFDFSNANRSTLQFFKRIPLSR